MSRGYEIRAVQMNLIPIIIIYQAYRYLMNHCYV